jgi:hypothetical protein
VHENAYLLDTYNTYDAYEQNTYGCPRPKFPDSYYETNSWTSSGSIRFLTTDTSPLYVTLMTECNAMDATCYGTQGPRPVPVPDDVDVAEPSQDNSSSSSSL